MPNIGAVLKEEITRLARKQIRGEAQALKRAATQHRSAIAALKRKVSELERAVSLLRKRGPAAVPVRAAAVSPSSDGGEALRFRAQGLKSNRERLGLSAIEYAKLIDVSPQSIYNWESGTARPRAAQLPALAALRGIGKKEVRARLDAIAAAGRKSRKT